MVDGCLIKLVNVLSGVPNGNLLDRLVFLLYTLELFSILENKLIGYADGSTFIPEGASPGVPESLIHDLGRVSEWCDLCEMKLKASETKTMIVSRSRTIQNPVTNINYWRNCAEEA